MAPHPPRHRTSALPLSFLCVALIVYASLYPFEGWRWPLGDWWTFLWAPKPRYWTAFDLVFNWLGYLPLGALAAIAVARRGGALWRAWMAGFMAGTLLSLVCEVLQNWLPSRVPSNLDWALNSVGAATGASLSVLALTMGGAKYWQRWRDRWFVERSSGGMTLLLLWPLALLFPLPVPMAVGQVADRVRIAVAELLADTPAALWWAQVGMPLQVRAPLLPPTEFMVTVLGQLLPCLVVYAVSPPGWRRIVMALSTGFVGLATTTLSTALNFGPEHALTWATELSLAAWASALLLALMLFWLSTRAAAVLGLMSATALIALVNQAPSDPYFAASLQAWEQGRFVHFHGAAQWVGWLWPYGAMLHLWVMTLAHSGVDAVSKNATSTSNSRL